VRMTAPETWTERMASTLGADQSADGQGRVSVWQEPRDTPVVHRLW
jgi:hypothetical protein